MDPKAELLALTRDHACEVCGRFSETPLGKWQVVVEAKKGYTIKHWRYWRICRRCTAISYPISPALQVLTAHIFKNYDLDEILQVQPMQMADLNVNAFPLYGPGGFPIMP